MKKAFAILLVLAIAMVGVFATSTNSINTNGSSVVLKYAISDFYNINYTLKAAIGSGNAEAYTSGSDLLVGTSDDGTFAAGSVTVTIVDNSVFNMSNARGYKFAAAFAAANEKTAASGGDPAVYAWKGTTVNGAWGPDLTLGAFTADSPSNGITASVPASGDDAGLLCVTYPAHTAVLGTADVSDLGSFTVSWSTSNTVAMDTYIATINITVTTV